MTTLTVLEDSLRDSDEQTQQHLSALAALRGRLQQAMCEPANPEQYQQIALLLEAVIQAEDIINVIYFRYHNHRINISD